MCLLDAVVMSFISRKTEVDACSIDFILRNVGVEGRDKSAVNISKYINGGTKSAKFKDRDNVRLTSRTRQ